MNGREINRVMRFDQDIPMRTPCCRRLTRPTHLFQYATTVRRRTCPRCGQQWSITIRPRKHILNGKGIIHALEWHRVIIERDVLCGWMHEVDELLQSLKSIAEYDATGSGSFVKAFKKCKEIARKSSTVIN